MLAGSLACMDGCCWGALLKRQQKIYLSRQVVVSTLASFSHLLFLMEAIGAIHVRLAIIQFSHHTIHTQHPKPNHPINQSQTIPQKVGWNWISRQPTNQTNSTNMASSLSLWRDGGYFFFIWFSSLSGDSFQFLIELVQSQSISRSGVWWRWASFFFKNLPSGK